MYKSRRQIAFHNKKRLDIQREIMQEWKLNDYTNI